LSPAGWETSSTWTTGATAQRRGASEMLPLKRIHVNTQKSTIFHGKIHYFNGHFQWIGLREILQENPMIFMGKCGGDLTDG